MKTKIILSWKRFLLATLVDFSVFLLFSLCFLVIAYVPQKHDRNSLFGLFAAFLMLPVCLFNLATTFRFWRYSHFELDSKGLSGAIYGFNLPPFDVTWEDLAKGDYGVSISGVFLPVIPFCEKKFFTNKFFCFLPKLSWIGNLAEVRDALKDVPDNPVKRLLMGNKV